MTTDQLKRLLSPGWEPGDGKMEGAQMVDGTWWHPVMGCDSLQYLIDDLKFYGGSLPALKNKSSDSSGSQ